MALVGTDPCACEVRVILGLDPLCRTASERRSKYDNPKARNEPGCNGEQTEPTNQMKSQTFNNLCFFSFVFSLACFILFLEEMHELPSPCCREEVSLKQVTVWKKVVYLLSS